jgi:hypothetical protein
MNTNKILSIVGVIVLGALGSGLWDLTKPFLGWLFSAAISISTLGLDSLRDGMYAQAASMLGRAVGLGVAMLNLLSFLCLIAVQTTQTFVTSGTLRRTRHLTIYQALFGAAFIGFFISGLRLSYVTQLSNHYERLETIAAPHMNEDELKRTRAELAQVQGREDFLKVVQSLSERIATSGGKPPTRSFF